MRGLTSFLKGRISDRTTLHAADPNCHKLSRVDIFLHSTFWSVFKAGVHDVTMQIRLFERESTLAKRSCENKRKGEALMHKALVSNINGQRTGRFALFSEEDS